MSSRKKRVYICAFFLVCLWFAFFMNIHFALDISDMVPHYTFAIRLRTISSIGLKSFIAEDPMSHAISYPAWHILFLGIRKIVYELCSLFLVPEDYGETVNIIAQAIENALLLTITFLIVLREFGKRNISIILAVCMMFIGPLFVPFINSHYYLGQLTANPWHNPTSFMIKPISVLIFFLYIKMVESREVLQGKGKNGFNESHYFIIFSGLLVISAFCKPNFYQVFLPALIVFCIIDLVMTKGKSFLFCVKTAVSVLPVCICAVIQFQLSFLIRNNGQSGICFSWLEMWHKYSQNIIGSIIISILFPLFVCYLYKKEILKDRMLLLSILLIFSAVLQFAFFYNLNFVTGDFLWGCYLSVFLLFMVSVIKMKEYKEKYGRNILYKIGAILFLLHFITGLGYFIAIFCTGNFLI